MRRSSRPLGAHSLTARRPGHGGVFGRRQCVGCCHAVVQTDVDHRPAPRRLHRRTSCTHCSPPKHARLPRTPAGHYARAAMAAAACISCGGNCTMYWQAGCSGSLSDSVPSNIRWPPCGAASRVVRVHHHSWGQRRCCHCRAHHHSQRHHHPCHHPSHHHRLRHPQPAHHCRHRLHSHHRCHCPLLRSKAQSHLCRHLCQWAMPRPRPLRQSR